MAQKEKTKRPDGATSHYARKRASGKMMYGPGCCAHFVSDEQVARSKQAAVERRRRERFDRIVDAAQGSDAGSLNSWEG
jgi:hypothetical protein